MSEQRIEQLQQMLQESPKDPFLVYALALEYRKQNLAKSLFYFQQLLQDQPAYLPTYYHAAELLVTLGKIQEAKVVYENGISLAKAQNDAHTLRELQNAYQNFLFENEDLLS